MPQKTSPEIEYQVLADFAETKSQTQTGKRLGMLQTTVGNILRRHGIHIGSGNRQVHRLPMGEIIQRYLVGEESISEIAQAYGVDDEMLRRRFVKRGVPIRTNQRIRGDQHLFWKGAKAYQNNKYHAAQIVEVCLGYKPPKDSVNHHMDENPKNNDPSNLRVFPSLKEHGRYHVQLLVLQRQGVAADASQLARENGGLELPPLPDGFELTPDKARLKWPSKKMPERLLGRLTYQPSQKLRDQRRARRKSQSPH